MKTNGTAGQRAATVNGDVGMPHREDRARKGVRNVTVSYPVHCQQHGSSRSSGRLTAYRAWVRVLSTVSRTDIPGRGLGSCNGEC